MRLIRRALLATGWSCTGHGFVAAPPIGVFSYPSVARGFNPVTATVEASTPPLTASSVEVLSPREAAIELPPIDPDTRSSFCIKWFEEGTPLIFDQATVSLQGRVVLSSLSPSSNYVALVRRAGTPERDAERLQFSTAEAEGNASGEMTELSRLEIRVGRCLEVSKHPDADSLYIETVDFGEEEPRTIVSGLVAYVAEEEMRGRMVLGLCNLPPRAMRGVTSAGMLLCASNDDHSRVDPLSPPEGAKTGELITFEGVISAPAHPSSSAARAWSATMDGMKTSGVDGVANWNEIPLQTSAESTCTSKDENTMINCMWDTWYHSLGQLGMEITGFGSDVLSQWQFKRYCSTRPRDEVAALVQQHEDSRGIRHTYVTHV